MPSNPNDFSRAECGQPLTMEYADPRFSMAAQSLPEPVSASSPFAMAMVFGLVAAVVSSAGYAAIRASSNWVSGFVAVGIGWLIAKAMMAATGGKGGETYQYAAAAMTYFAVTIGRVLSTWWIFHDHVQELGHDAAWLNQILLREAVAGPVLALTRNPGPGLLSLIFLIVGIRSAWRTAKGTKKPAPVVKQEPSFRYGQKR